MKKRVFIVTSCLLLSVFILNAFVMAPRTRLSNSKGNNIQIDYLEAYIENDELILPVEYRSEDSFFIVKDLIVTDDAKLENPLTLISGTPEENKIIYKFECQDKIDKIFVKSPIFYFPTEIDNDTIACKEGEVAYLPDGTKWFYIQSVDVIEQQVHLLIIPYISTFPRLPHLVINGMPVGSTISMNINPDNVFDYGEIIFDVPEEFSNNLNADIKGSYITINNAMFRVKDGEQDITEISVRR